MFFASSITVLRIGCLTLNSAFEEYFFHIRNRMGTHHIYLFWCYTFMKMIPLHYSSSPYTYRLCPKCDQKESSNGVFRSVYRTFAFVYVHSFLSSPSIICVTRNTTLAAMHTFTVETCTGCSKILLSVKSQRHKNKKEKVKMS